MLWGNVSAAAKELFKDQLKVNNKAGTSRAHLTKGDHMGPTGSHLTKLLAPWAVLYTGCVLDVCWRQSHSARLCRDHQTVP
jgi:hypothetical protein